MEWSDIEDEAEEIQLFEPTISDASISHCCRHTDLEYIEENYLKLLQTSCHIIETLNPESDTQCLLNEVYNSTLSVYNVSIGSSQFVNEIVNFCDIFMRQRHEILHMFFMKSVNKDQARTDMKFCDLFEIDSIRTPDYIEISGKDVVIIETSVTSDVGKSYMMKGKEDKGYKSKYEVEIQELKSLGYKIDYVVVVYNMRDVYDMSYKAELKVAEKIFGLGDNSEMVSKLEFLRRGFCRIQTVFGKKLSMYNSLLFRKGFVPDIECKKTMDYLCQDEACDKSSYLVSTISQAQYGRLLNSLPRIRAMHDELESQGNFELHLDLVRGKYRFSPPIFSTGMSHSDWSRCLNNFDRANIVLNTYTVVDGLLVGDTAKSIEMIVPSHTEVQKIKLELTAEIHTTTLFYDYPFIFKPYNLTAAVEQLRYLKFEDHEYEVKIERLIVDYLERKTGSEFVDDKDFPKKKPFATNIISEQTFKNALINFKSSYSDKNDFSADSKHILHQKPSFSYPLFCCNGSKPISIKDKPTDLLNSLLRMDIGDYTKILVRKALEHSFFFGSKQVPPPNEIYHLEAEVAAKHREMHKFQFTNRTADGVLLKLKEIPGGDKLSNEYKAIIKELKEKSKEHNYKRTNISLIRLPTKKRRPSFSGNGISNTGLGMMFQAEMSHYKDKSEVSVYKGVGRYDQKILNNEFQDLKRTMLSPSGLDFPDKVYDDYASDDRTLLHQLKSSALDQNRALYDFLRGTNIYASAAMVSRFCYTLLYFSQTSISSDYVLLDNLGLSNTLLICKGGKKIFKTKKSKLFRLIFKTYQQSVNSYCRPGYISNFKSFKKDGEDYIITPWMSLNETLLTDGLTFLSRTMGYVMMNVTKRSQSLNILNDCYFNIMLAWHARRKTEVFMHSMRYIVVNSMSEISCLDKMLPELADFNYDFFQALLRESLMVNFVAHGLKLKAFHDEFKGGQPDILMKQLDLKHMYDSSVTIDSMEALTLTIYCTFLMSKAPVTQSLEQTSNLFAMLKTHEQHNDNRPTDMIGQYETTTVTVDNCDNLEDYWDKLFESDFHYDPKYVTLLGNMCSDYLLTKKTASEISSKWESIMEEPWDKMANTSGLRGDRGTDFFGKKGYYVVYKEVMKDEIKLQEALKLMDSDLDDYTKRKELNHLNQSFAKKIKSTKLEQIIFHVVDKIQRSGKREIYVMDYMTKLNQQPIEKFFAYICKLVPNELISTPSNKRLFQIHSTVFEKFLERDGICYNLSLDCRRWAPHSVINKFLDFILGMRGCLPEGLVVHCLNFFEKMFDKRVYTRKYIYDIMDKNDGMTAKQKGYFVEDEDVKGYYMTMSYSWVMGIFNYLSSLLHVMNQMHSTQMIMRCNSIVFNADFEMHMNAHSDDSGGKLITPSRSLMVKSFTIYELLLKSSNHMLSDKKCNISKTYLELLSILYIGNRLLSLLNKFAGAFDFHPSDKGYCVDIMESYSKSTELIINGANFSQAYIALKIMSFLIWRFYFGNTVPRSAYSIPPQLAGMPDAHPLNVLMCGGDADIIRLEENHSQNKVDSMSITAMVYISKYFNPQTDLMDTFIVPITCEPQIIMSKQLRNLQEVTEGLSEDVQWFVRNVQQTRTPLLLFNYIEKLKTKTFCASMQDETLIRRISRAFYYRSSRACRTEQGFFSYTDIKDMIQLFSAYLSNQITVGPWSELVTDVMSSYEDFMSKGEHISDQFNLLHSEIILINRSFNDLGFIEDDVVLSAKTCKPIHMNIQRVNTPLTQDFKPDNLTCWVTYPKLRWLLPPSGYDNQIMMLRDFLSFKNKEIPINNPNWLFRLLSKYKGKYLKEMYFHSNMPAGSRDINNYRDVLFFLAHNSFDNKYIEGIVSPYNRTMSLPIEQVFEDFMEGDLSLFMNMLDLYSGLITRQDLLNGVLSLKINNFDGNLKDYLIQSGSELADKYYVFDILNPHLQAITNSSETGRVNNPQILKNSFFHCFVKRQHLIGNVWLGKGKLFVSLPSSEIMFDIDNQRVSGLTISNNTASLTKHEITYVDYILQSSQLNGLRMSMESVKPKDWNLRKFGITEQGNFCVNYAKDLIAYIPATSFGRKVHPILSNIDLCNVRIMNRLKYTLEFQDYTGRRETLVIHTFDMPNTRLLNACNAIFNNDENRESINKQGVELKDYLTDVVGETTQSERRVRLKHLADSYTVSRLYSVFKTLIDRQDYNPTRNFLRSSVYPGQEGGMLDLLIKYKIANPEFMFKHERVLTPELMHLKSTQPEVFISNLVTKVDEKYRTLYDSKDRMIIMSQLLKIMSRVGDEESEADLITLLSTWSYIGVVGALGESKANKVPETFKFFRYDPSKALFVDFSKKFLEDFFTALIYCYEQINMADLVKDKTYKLPKNRKQLSLFIVSMTHSQVLTSYGTPVSYNDYRLTSHNIALYELLTQLFALGEFQTHFYETVNDLPIITNMPVSENYSRDWLMVIVTIFNNLNISIRNTINLKNNTLIQREITPLVVTQDLLKNIVRFDVKKMYHNGTISRDFYRDRRGRHTIVQNKKHFTFDFRPSEPCKRQISINHEFVLKRPIAISLDEDDEDFEDEFAEFSTELMSKEPDLDYIEETFKEEWMIPGYNRSISLATKTGLCKSNLIRLNVINLVGMSGHQKIASNLLDIGETILIISDFILTEFVPEDECPQLAIFKSRSRPWTDRSIIDPQFLFYHIKDSEEINTNPWCEYLDATYLSFNMVRQMMFTTPFGDFYNHAGVLLENNILERNFEKSYDMMRQSYEILNRTEEEVVTEETAEVVPEPDIYDKMLAKGFSQSLVDKYKTSIRESEGQGSSTKKLMEDIITRILSEGDKTKQIESAIAKILAKKNDKSFLNRVFELPTIFATSGQTNSDLKNQALRDTMLRAELESLCSGLTNKILSGMLNVGERKLKFLTNQIKLYKAYAKMNANKEKNKLFLIDVAICVINDARVVEDSDCDHIWDRFVENLTEYIAESDDDSDNSDMSVYGADEGTGNLKYDII